MAPRVYTFLILSTLLAGCSNMSGVTDARAAYGGFFGSSASSQNIEAGGLIAQKASVGAMLFRVMPQIETLLVLGSRNGRQYETWYGGGGFAMVIRHGRIYSTSGLAPDLLSAYDISDCAISQYLTGEATGVKEMQTCERMLRYSDQEAEVLEVRKILAVDNLENEPYWGQALRIEEVVLNSGGRNPFRNTTWIEPKSKKIIRVQTRLRHDEPPTTIEVFQ